MGEICAVELDITKPDKANYSLIETREILLASVNVIITV